MTIFKEYIHFITVRNVVLVRLKLFVTKCFQSQCEELKARGLVSLSCATVFPVRSGCDARDWRVQDRGRGAAEQRAGAGVGARLIPSASGPGASSSLSGDFASFGVF